MCRGVRGRGGGRGRWGGEGGEEVGGGEGGRGGYGKCCIPFLKCMHPLSLFLSSGWSSARKRAHWSSFSRAGSLSSQLCTERPRRERRAVAFPLSL